MKDVMIVDIMNQVTGSTWLPPDRAEFIPDIGSITLNAGQEIATTLKQKLQATGSGLLWLTDQTPVEDYKIVEGVVYDDQPEWARGRRDSVQGVFFGRLALGDVLETPVAVKPFLTAFNAGAHETAMLLNLEGMGLRVYRVLGMSRSEDQGYCLITGFEEESRSLDNVQWSKGIEAPLGNHLTNLEALEQVGRSLGIMHGNGIIHNDAQIKNFAVNGEEVVLIDLVGARSMISRDGYVDEAKLQAGMYRDLKMLVDSLRSRGFLKGASTEELGMFFTNVIATSYRSGLFLAEGGLTARGVHVEALVKGVIDDMEALFEPA